MSHITTFTQIVNGRVQVCRSLGVLSCNAHLSKIRSNPQVRAIPLRAFRSVTSTNSSSFDFLGHLDLGRGDHIYVDHFLPTFLPSGAPFPSSGLCLLSAPVLSAPLQPRISQTLCSDSAPRLMYVPDVVLMSAQLTPAGSGNGTRRRVCAVDLVTCLDCHLELTVVSGQLSGCRHRDPCRLVGKGRAIGQ